MSCRTRSGPEASARPRSTLASGPVSVFLALLTGCTPSVEEESGGAPILADSVVYVARDLLLERPRDVAPFGSSQVVVADIRAVYFVDSWGSSEPAEVGSIGGAGDGPGEFRRVDGVSTDGDAILVLDGRRRRVLRYSPVGELLDDWSLGGAASTRTSVAGNSGLHVNGRVTTLEMRGGVIGLEPADPHELVTYDPDTGDRRVRFEWPGARWIDLEGGMNVPRSAADERPAAAVSQRLALAAVAVDRSPCVTVTDLTAEGDGRRDICVPWEPVNLSPPSLDEEVLDGVPTMTQTMLRALDGARDYSGTADGILDIVFDGGGCLWLHVSNAEASDPLVLGAVPALRPDTYEWRVVDPDTEMMLGTVLLPSMFSPAARQGSIMHGFLLDDLGAQWLAGVAVPAFSCGESPHPSP